MEKVNCLITLSNNENTTNDYLTVHHDPDKKTIFYEEKDKTTVTYNYETNTLKRESIDIEISGNKYLKNSKINEREFEFKLTQVDKDKREIKDENGEKIEKTQDKLIISYKIDDNYFTFKIEKV